MTTFVPPLQIDVESWCVTWLTTWLGSGTRVSTELPAGLEAACPLVKVARLGGPNDGINVDIATVELQSFAAAVSGQSGAAARDVARKLAYRAGKGLFAARGASLNGVTVVDVGQFSGPRWVDYENAQVRRFAATYQVRVKPA